MLFLLSRYAIVAVALIGLLVVARMRSTRFGLGLIVTLGAISWLITWAPLEKPYGLQPGTATSFDTALAVSGAARGDVLEGWIVGQRNPRPGWSALWYAVAPGRPERVLRLLEWFTPVMMMLVACIVFWLLYRRGGPWLGLTCGFAALFASTVPLDAFAPYSFVYHGLLFATPQRAFGLGLVLLALGLVWNSGVTRLGLGGLVLGSVAWVNLAVFAWGMLAFVAGEILAPTRQRARWASLVIGVLVASPHMLASFREGFLRRIPTAEEVSAYQLGFRDVFGITGDMGWIFVVAVVSLPLLWRSREGVGLPVLSLLTASYGLWIASAAIYHARPFSEPEIVYYLLRVATAITAGAGAYELGRRVAVRLRDSGFLTKLAPEALAFGIVLLFLLPDSALFVWRPLMTNPIYYESFYEWDESLRRLERWVLEHTDADTIVLTGEDTGEWIAALTGRRVWMAERALGREEARKRRRALRGIFLSGDPEVMGEAIETTGASLLVLDPALREVYWERGETTLQSSTMFERVHQIGDRYSIYRVQ